MRKLVTIREIKEVLPIEGADAIEIVKIDGWQCVAKKGEFKPGDQAAYFEIDSFLPEGDERFSFLAGRGVQTNGDGKKGYRLRTIKLRGQLSQGLALPASLFDSEFKQYSGDDLAEAIGVTKWEPALPAQLAGQAKGLFPSFLKKTDQERIQNVPGVLNDKFHIYEVTQKLDGSSCSIYWNNGEFGVCSRNLELKETDGNSFWLVANRYKLREQLSSLGMNICLQGELVGPGIQGNPHGLKQVDFYLFDIWLIDEQRYASSVDRSYITSIGGHLEGIKHVPFVAYKTLEAFETVNDLLDYADSIPDELNANNKAPEGLVFKRTDGSTSFKVISNRYLLKEK